MFDKLSGVKYRSFDYRCRLRQLACYICYLVLVIVLFSKASYHFSYLLFMSTSATLFNIYMVPVHNTYLIVLCQRLCVKMLYKLEIFAVNKLKRISLIELTIFHFPLLHAWLFRKSMQIINNNILNKHRTMTESACGPEFFFLSKDVNYVAYLINSSGSFSRAYTIVVPSVH